MCPKKITSIKKFVFIEKIFALKNYLHWKNHFKDSKKGNHQKYGIRTFHIFVSHLYSKGNYRKVAQKLSITLVFKRVFV
jgi:hypothetical protein